MTSMTLKEQIENASLDEVGIRLRREVSEMVCEALRSGGQMLWVGGTIIGPDRVEGESPFGYGSDATVGLATVLQIAGELMDGAIALLKADNRYAAAALIRQLVEAEYLAWAFGDDEDEAAQWMRASRRERQDFWRPARIRDRAGNRFRGSDYWSHCSQGGHPSPEGMVLLPDHQTPEASVPIWWADLAMHATSIWRYGFAAAEGLGLAELLDQNDESSRVDDVERRWRDSDPLIRPANALAKARERRERPLPQAWIAD